MGTNTLQEKLTGIQQALKVPKNQKNAFGGYMYRSCEDILEAVKPLLLDCNLIINDEMVNIGNRYYVKAVASLSCGKELITATAYAREPETKKGMDEAQITGATSSYARKYALNGLFLIDDTRDADAMNNASEAAIKPKKAIVQKDLEEHFCTIHNKPMKKRIAPNGGFYWDHRYTIEDGSWIKCNGLEKHEKDSFTR